VKAKLYIEGGAPGKDADSVFRRGWRTFLERAVGRSAKFAVVRGGSRNETWKKFKMALGEAKADELPILVVDSEAAVTEGSWQHLAGQDDWKKPKGVGEDQVFLMVQAMETWFLADREGLESYFGSGFSASPLQDWPDLEAVDKKKVLEVLGKATKASKNPYQKGSASFKLLATLDPKKVEAACPQARRLLDRLRSL
jgi:Domain of unknown function (DUF4276)